jgi:hypothetical protein
MRILTLVLLLGLAAVPVGFAQVVEPPTTQQKPPNPKDTIPVPPFRVEPPVSPAGAAVRSLLIPGWGQSIVGRRVTGAVFVFWAGKRSEVQDWAVLLACNHLLAAAEAYVSTNLWDFPGDLHADRLPSGDPGLGLRLYW